MPLDRLTRRAVLGGGLAAATAASFGVWGRFALGEEFEQHVASRLGLDLDLTKRLLMRMREERGDYDLRAAAFLVATQDPAALVLPRGLRQEAVEGFLGPMFGLSRRIVVPLAYAGLRDSAEYVPCEVLVPS